MKKEKATKSLIPKKAEIGTSYDYLKNTDPNAYFYRKFKDENNEYLNDNMWNTATQSGQLDSLIYLLNSGNIDKEYFDKYKQYENMADYDTYMATLKLNTYDDTEKKLRENNVEMTDREYMKAILDEQYRQFDYKIIEDEKANMNIFNKIASGTGYAIGTFGKEIASGVLSLAQLVQGTGYFLWAGMKDTADLIATGGKNQLNMGTEFLRAFDDIGDRDIIDKSLTYLQDELLAFEDRMYRDILYNTDLVNAEDAQYLDDVERGQLTMIEYLARKNSGAGMNFGGEFVKGVTEAIGFLVPSIAVSKVGNLIGKTASKIARATFFGQLESSNIKENTQMYLLNGSSLEQINAAEVISNATIKTSLEYGIEKLMSFTLGSTLLDGMIGMGTNRTLISSTKKLASTSNKAQKSVERVNKGIYKGDKAGIVSRGWTRLGIDAAKEGLEEVIQDFSNNMVDLTYGGYYAKRGADNNSLENYFQSFIIGAFTSGIISSVKTGIMNEKIITADGNIKNVYGFKAMSIQDAMQQMIEWKNEIVNTNLSVQERLENAKAFTEASMMLAPIYSAFSEEDLTKALNILDGYKNAKLSQSISSSTLPISRQINLPSVSVDNRTIDVSGDYSIHTERISSDINVIRFDSENASKYCNDILNKINAKRAEIQLKPITKETRDRVQQVMKDNADKLEKAGANEINNIVTDDGCYINIEGKPIISKELSRIIKELGIKTVVGTNGNILITDKDIMIVDNKILETEDIATLIQTDAYSRAVKSAIFIYRTKYNKLYNHILNTYTQCYGTEENAESVFNSLLFDKSFFIKVLLSCNTNDTLSKQIVALFEVMNVTDKTVKAITERVTNFNTKTYKAAMIKAKEVLRDGIILYGTQYQNISPIIERMPKSVISDDVKKELMNNNNVRLSNNIDDITKEKEPSKLLKVQNDIINTCDIMIKDYQKKFDSLNQNDKINANNMINLLSDVKTLIGSDNLLDRQQGKILFVSYLHSIQSTSSTTYLPTDVKDATIAEMRKSFKKYTGISVKDFISGKWTVNNLKDNARLYLIGSGISNTSPENVLISAAKEIVYEISDKQFTINENGALLKIINLLDICDKKILDRKFKELKSGKSFKIKDIITLSDNKILNTLGDIEIIPNKSTDVYNGVYFNNNNTIEINTTKVKSFDKFIDTIAHEFTHAVDYNLFLNLNNKYWARGGSIDDIKNIFSKSEKNRFEKWLNEKMPYLTKYADILLRQENISPDAYLFYIMTQGELNAYGFNNMYDISGTLVERKSSEKSNQFQLRMLDGTTFDITPIYNKYLTMNDKKIPKKTETKKTETKKTETKKTETKKTETKKIKQESISLFGTTLYDKLKSPEISKSFGDKTSYFTDDNGIHIPLFRGTNTNEQLTNDFGNNIAYFSSSPKIAMSYTHFDEFTKLNEILNGGEKLENVVLRPTLEQYVINATRDEVLVINVNKRYWENMNDFDLSTDDFVEYFAKQKKYKFLVINDIVEDVSSITATNVIMLGDYRDRITKISKPDTRFELSMASDILPYHNEIFKKDNDENTAKIVEDYTDFYEHYRNKMNWKEYCNKKKLPYTNDKIDYSSFVKYRNEYLQKIKNELTYIYKSDNVQNWRFNKDTIDKIIKDLSINKDLSKEIKNGILSSFLDIYNEIVNSTPEPKRTIVKYKTDLEAQKLIDVFVKKFDYKKTNTINLDKDIKINDKHLFKKYDEDMTVDIYSKNAPLDIDELSSKSISKLEEKVTDKKGYTYINKEIASTGKFAAFYGKRITNNIYYTIEQVSLLDDYDNLSGHFKKLIESGELSDTKLQYYLSNVKSLNDYTFKFLALNYYKNAELAKLTFKQFRDILMNIRNITYNAALKSSVEANTVMSVDNILKLKVIPNLTKLNEEYSPFRLQFADFTADYYYNTKSKDYIPVIGERDVGIDDLDEETRSMIKRMTTGNRWLHANLVTSNPLLVQGVLMKLYDGTLQSIIKTNRTCLQISYMQSYRPDPKLINAETNETEQSTWNWIDNVNYADKTFADDVNIYDDSQGGIDDEIELTTDQKLESIRLYVYRQEYEKWITAITKKLNETNKNITLEKFLSMNMTDKYGNSLDVTKLEYIKNKAYEKADDTINKINNIDNDYDRQEFIDNLYRKSSVVIDNKLVIESTQPNLDTINKDTKVYKKRKTQKTAREKLYSSIKSLKTTLQKNIDDYMLLPDELKKLFKIENGKVIEKKITKTDTKANSEVIISNINNTNDEKKEFKQKVRTTTQYRNYTEEQINDLTGIILQTVQNIRRYRKDIAKMADETEKNNRKILKKMLSNDVKDNKPIVQKINVDYVKVDNAVTHTVNNNFQVIADRAPTKMVTDLLSTTFSKSAERNIQATGDKLVVDTWNGKEFFKQNANTFANADVYMLEETARWFLSAKLKNMSIASNEYKLFTAANFYFMMWIQSQCRDGGKFDNFDRDLFKECTAMYNNLISSSGAQMGAHRSLIHQIEPEKVVEEQSIVLDGISLSKEERKELLNASKTMNVDKINKLQDKISQRISQEVEHRTSFLSKITSIRQSFMLSSPLTWIRNIVSNYVLKSLNKLSDKIGNLLLNKYKRHQDVFVDQYRLNVKPTKETVDFVNKNFIENELYDKLISHLSRFNNNDFSQLDKDFTGKPTLEAIFTKIVIDSLYAKYYTENTFKNNNIAGKAFNEIHKFIMKMLSDNNIIKKVSLDYFAKILQENNRDLSQGLTDFVMRDFVTAFQLGLNDYMHSDNMFTDIREAFVNKGQVAQFLFDNTLPFVATTWNWFKTMLKFTPIGIIKGTWTLIHLDKAYDKADTLYTASVQKFSNKSLDPKLTAYLAARDLGSGIIGTALISIGMLMGALGWLDIDDDDYDVPKVKFTIGDVIVKLDVSSVFGSSSLLAGAALVIDAHKNGVSLENIMKGIGANLDFLNTQNPVMTLLELDMGQGTALDKLSNYAHKYFLSFIPNFLSFVSGSIFQTGGEPVKDRLYQKALAKLPFGDLLLDKKRSPYTGEYTTDYWNNLINKGVPYISYKIASQNERRSTEYGLNKSQLKGKYNINGKSFTANNVDELNKLYGQMNAKELTDFYSNKTFFKIKSGTKYKTLSYNQMTDEQRKSIVQRIMSNNANIIKIKAWTDKGNLYYADNTLYKDLIKAGVVKNVYKGNKGYVEK